MPFLRRFAEYVLSNRKHAIWIVLLFSVMPLFGWVSSVVVGFVTLRQGVREGLFVLAWSVLPAVIIGFLGYPMIAANILLAGNILAWVLSAVLRKTVSWRMVLFSLLGYGFLVIVGVHLIWPQADIIKHWTNILTLYVDRMDSALFAEFSPADIQRYIGYGAQVMTGTNVAVMLFFGVMNVVLARGLQAMLFNPGGMKQELLGVRLNGVALLLLAVCMGGSYFGLPLAFDMLPILFLAFFLAGLSLMHGLVLQRFSKPWFWLGGLYFLLVILPYTAFLLVLFALFDAVADFRHRFI